MADPTMAILILEADIVWLIVSSLVQTPLKIPYSLSLSFSMSESSESQSLLKIYSFNH